MRTIPLTKGKVAIVDDEDFEELAKYKWHISLDGYACRSVHKPFRYAVRMHRDLVGARKRQIVDHVNGDTLDNRKSNLRICTHAENMRNRTKKGMRNGRKTSSAFKGVFWAKKSHAWQATIVKNRQAHIIGYFDDEVDAAAAYNKAARDLFGRFAKCNVID